MNLSYIIRYKPFLSDKANKIEIMNETMIWLSMNLVTLLLNNDLKLKDRVSVGNSLIFIASFNIFLNLTIMIIGCGK